MGSIGRSSINQEAGPLQTERCSDGTRELLRCLVVDVTVDNQSMRLEIPGGFNTDFSSIPPWAACLVRWSKVDVAGGRS